MNLILWYKWTFSLLLSERFRIMLYMLEEGSVWLVKSWAWRILALKLHFILFEELLVYLFEAKTKVTVSISDNLVVV